MEQLEVRGITDNNYYKKGMYIMFGNSELRSGVIFCKCYNEKDLNILLSILNDTLND
jgi:hypothetical protein